MSEYSGTYEFVFFHDQKKGEIIVIMNGQKHVFDDGVSKAVEAERERIIKLLDNQTVTHPAEAEYLAHLIDIIKGEQK